MANEKLAEGMSDSGVRRAYEAPTVRDFFQPVVVLGTVGTVTVLCEEAKPKRPKR